MNDATKIAVAVAVVGVAVASVLIAYAVIQNTGKIIGFGVQPSIEAIDWGAFAPGQSKQVAFSLQSTSDINGTLSMTSDAPSYLTLSWDSENAVLQPQETRLVTATLTANSDAPLGQTFNFDITITLTGGE